MNASTRKPLDLAPIAENLARAVMLACVAIPIVIFVEARRSVSHEFALAGVVAVVALAAWFVPPSTRLKEAMPVARRIGPWVAGVLGATVLLLVGDALFHDTGSAVGTLVLAAIAWFVMRGTRNGGRSASGSPTTDSRTVSWFLAGLGCMLFSIAASNVTYLTFSTQTRWCMRHRPPPPRPS